MDIVMLPLSEVKPYPNNPRRNDDAELCEWTNKHKYLYPLDKKMRKQIMPLSKPYPKKEQSEAA